MVCLILAVVVGCTAGTLFRNTREHMDMGVQNILPLPSSFSTPILSSEFTKLPMICVYYVI